MIRFFQRLRNRKGFTMIELMVVIAIIGILTAIILPALNYDSKPNIAKAAAKDFYYKTQEAFSLLKMSSEDALGSGTYSSGITIYATVSDNGIVTGSGVVTGSVEDFTVISATGDAKKMMAKLEDEIKQYLTDVSGLQGTFYATADSEFRVQAAYWTDSPTTLVDGTQLSDDGVLDGYYLLAYPANECTAGAKLKIKN